MLQVKRSLLKQHEALERVSDYLPGGEKAFAGLFTNLVVNYGAATEAHKDRDMGFCVVLVLGDCKGGSLVLKEPALALDLKPGSIVAFPSDRITHFNEHFEGLRVSVVLHTEKDMIPWMENYNGWSHRVEGPPSLSSLKIKDPAA